MCSNQSLPYTSSQDKNLTMDDSARKNILSFQAFSREETRRFPLYHAGPPQSLLRFSLDFPDGTRATFHDSEFCGDGEVVEGKGWQMSKKSETLECVNLKEALERYRSSYRYDADSRGSIQKASTRISPPRQRLRCSSPRSLAVNRAEAPSTSAFLTIPALINRFSSLPPQVQSHVLFAFLRHSPSSVLRTLNIAIAPTFARDILVLLPFELASMILSYLSLADLAHASQVSKSWCTIIDTDVVLWQDLMKLYEIWSGGDVERAFSKRLYHRKFYLKSPVHTFLPPPHPYKVLFKSRYLTCMQWSHNLNPKHISFSAHDTSKITGLLFSRGRIISSSDNCPICVHSPVSGELIHTLNGHEGGVWALAVTKNTLVSGSTDCTVRIWDLAIGRCRHVFRGHKRTVRCLVMVKPEWAECSSGDGSVHKERWPKCTLIVSGSRDCTIRVWRLPKLGERCGTRNAERNFSNANPEDKLYHRLLLRGHGDSVRTLAARGRILVSGSYDCTVRIWDVITGQNKWVLRGHTKRVYSVILNSHGNQVYSSSMDKSVRIWNPHTGQCIHILDHASPVGLLGSSPSYVVSASSDSNLHIWDPHTGKKLHALTEHTSFITCFKHDEYRLVSGSDGLLRVWDIKKGTVIRDLLKDITNIYEVVIKGGWCIAASNRQGSATLDVWNFGRDNGGMDDSGCLGEFAAVGEINDEESSDEDR